MEVAVKNEKKSRIPQTKIDQSPYFVTKDGIGYSNDTTWAKLKIFEESRRDSGLGIPRRHRRIKSSG